MDGDTGIIPETVHAEADLAERFYAWLDALRYEKRYSKHTLRAYSRDIIYFFEFLTNHLGKEPSLNDLGDASLVDFRSWLSKRMMEGASNTTRARQLSSVRSFMKWLDKCGYLHNPFIGLVRTPKKPKKLPKPLPEAQAKQLVAYHEQQGEQPEWVAYRDQALFTLLYGCGLRIGEALQLNFGTRPQEGAVKVLGKGSKERIVPVLPVVEQAISEYLARCPCTFDKDTPLFLGSRGERLNQGVAQRQLRTIRRALGLPESLTPHALRHSFATHILVHGGNLRVIQELLGHASVSTTQKYTDLDNKQLLDVYNNAHPRAHLTDKT